MLIKTLNVYIPIDGVIRIWYNIYNKKQQMVFEKT